MHSFDIDTVVVAADRLLINTNVAHAAQHIMHVFGAKQLDQLNAGGMSAPIVKSHQLQLDCGRTAAQLFGQRQTAA